MVTREYMIKVLSGCLGMARGREHIARAFDEMQEVIGLELDHLVMIEENWSCDDDDLRERLRNIEKNLRALLPK